MNDLTDNFEATVIRAFRPGDTVILRATMPLSMETMRRMSEMFEAVSAKTGIKFVLIDNSLEVVRREA